MNSTTAPTPNEIASDGAHGASEPNDVADLQTALYDGLVSYDAARDVLGVSRYTLSSLVRYGKLTKQVIARRHFVTRASLTAYIAELRAEAKARDNARPHANPVPRSA